MQYQPMLQNIAMKMLKCKADAEDIVQETFIKWLNTEQEKIKNTRAYLITSVRNNCINHIKTLQRKKEEYLDNFQWPEFIEKFKDTDFSGIDIEAKLAEAFHILQDKLEPLERAVYLLKEVFDFDYQMLQDILDKKQDHCRQLLCRAKKKLNEEKAHLNAVFQPKKTALLESFSNACDLNHIGTFVSELRNDIAAAISKKI
nr:sigma-70 family RNA polymerase sigma factor [Chryseosolibacter indicus]